MFNNITNQINGLDDWLGHAISKFFENEEENSPDWEEVLNENMDDATSNSFESSEIPTELFENIKSKASSGVESLKNLIFSTGKTLQETGAKIKETIEENTLLNRFNQEQENFIQTRCKIATTARLPWEGCLNEELAKEEILRLSSDRRNFLRSPPTGVDFGFDYNACYPIAAAIMKYDHDLEEIRYQLVPKTIREEQFWRNYFYRVNLICQANEISFLNSDSMKFSDFEIISEPTELETKSSNEFVSDALRLNSEDFHGIQEDVKNLLLCDLGRKQDDWEKELEVELRDYEVVAKNMSKNTDRKLEKDAAQ